MSDFRAIAGVSSTLQRLLRDRMDTTDVPVTLAPPDVTLTGDGGQRVNLYLYHVGENGSLKNREIYGHGPPAAYGFPPLSLDLRYLLTAYPANESAPDGDVASQQLLGGAMRVLHDFPLVTADLQIQRTTAGPVGDPILDGTLLHEFERVKVTLEPASLEELAKLWTALPQANLPRAVADAVSAGQNGSAAGR